MHAVGMLGTGMPTLAPIASVIGWSGASVMSCNLCLAWRMVAAVDERMPDAAGLEPWLRGEGWVRRLNEYLGSAAA